MFRLNYQILKTTEKGDVAQMFEDCLSRLNVLGTVIRISVFWGPKNGEDYWSDANVITKVVNDIYFGIMPTLSLIAQKPLSSEMYLEVVQLESEQDVTVLYRQKEGIPYVILLNDNYQELHLSGVSAPMGVPFQEQTAIIFRKLLAVLQQENLSVNSIVRQWNYIERITEMEGDYQRYQLFNDARTDFYEKVEWPKGYPAATGIGTQAGGIVVDCVAVSGSHGEYALVNPLQLDAHAYTQDVLVGAKDVKRNLKTTPKFERAKYLSSQGGATVFVSGTAAIRGEESLGGQDPAQQTQITLENIDSLVSKENIGETISMNCESGHFQMFRVYVKCEDDLSPIRKVCKEKHPNVVFSYLLSDVCRDELLVEIEAIVRFVTAPCECSGGKDIENNIIIH